MTYSDCISQLEKQGLSVDFVALFETRFTTSFLDRLKHTDRINSVASLIRASLDTIEKDSTDWDKWVSIMKWYMMPEFERKNNNPY